MGTAIKSVSPAVKEKPIKISVTNSEGALDREEEEEAVTTGTKAERLHPQDTIHSSIKVLVNN